MPISAPDFINLLAGLVESLPHHKALSERGLAFAWVSLPDAAKQLTIDHLSYAATQRLLDPDPNQKLAIHIQLLAYIFPLRDGLPATDRPVRHDLAERMRSPHRFHPLSPAPAHAAPALPPFPSVLSSSPSWQEEPLEQRRRRLEHLAQQTQSRTKP